MNEGQHLKPISAIKSIFSKKSVSNTRELGHSLSHFPTYSGGHDDYENVYASVRPIANRFASLTPYAIDKNGKKVENVPALNALYRPNKQMSFTQFLDAVAVGVKTAPEVNILVWRWEGNQARPGGDITAKNIAGYTFLQRGAIIDIYGNRVFEVQQRDGSIKTYTEDEVITLTDSRNPLDLSKGYSPAQAARRWTRIDDYLADYQAGFFRNGAVPAGMFTVVAPTLNEFNDIVKNMQAKHQGADKNNNVAYSYTPVGADGKPATTSTITWTPFNVANKDLELPALFENSNQKIDSAFGVPGIIRGQDDQATYSNAQVSERVFVVNVLEPFVRSIYAQFTHELNRITGGLGIALTADVEIPSVADEEKTEAETLQLNLNSIIIGTNAGFSLESVVDALKLPNNYKLLKKGTSTQTQIENDKPQVDEGGEVDAAPDQDIDGNASIAYVKGEAKGTDPKVKRLPKSKVASTEKQVEAVAQKYTKIQVDAALNATKAVGELTEEIVVQFADELLSVLVTSMIASGELEYAVGIQILTNAGLPTTGTTSFLAQAATIDSYRNYLVNVAQSYSTDTAASIRKVLDTANVEGWTKAELQKNLRGIIKAEEYRAVRLAVTETNYSQQMGALNSMRQIQGETNILFRKVWNTSGTDPCEYCQAMNGTTIGLEDAFIPLGGTVEGVDGGEYHNDFVKREESTLHPHCHCYLTYEVVGAQKAVDVDDSQAIYDVETGRYLGHKLKNGYIAIRGLKSNKDTIVKVGDYEKL